MKILKRLNRLWKLSNKDPKALNKLENLSDEQMAVIPEIGNGKAVFIGQGTEEEFKQMEKEDKGFKGIFGL